MQEAVVLANTHMQLWDPPGGEPGQHTRTANCSSNLHCTRTQHPAASHVDDYCLPLPIKQRLAAAQILGPCQNNNIFAASPLTPPFTRYWGGISCDTPASHMEAMWQQQRMQYSPKHTHRQAAPKQYRTRTTADTLHTPRVRCRHKDVTWGRITQVQTNQQYVVFVGVALYNGMQVTRPHTQDYLWWYVQQGIMPLLVAHLSQAAFSASHCQERHTSCTKHASASAPEKAATTVDDTNHTFLLKPSP